MRQRLKAPVAKRLREVVENIEEKGHFQGNWSKGECCLVVNPAFDELSEDGDLYQAMEEAYKIAAGTDGYIGWNDKNPTDQVLERLRVVADELEAQVS